MSNERIFLFLSFCFSDLFSRLQRFEAAEEEKLATFLFMCSSSIFSSSMKGFQSMLNLSMGYTNWSWKEKKKSKLFQTKNKVSVLLWNERKKILQPSILKHSIDLSFALFHMERGGMNALQAETNVLHNTKYTFFSILFV